MMENIDIFYSHFTSQFPTDQWESYLARLPTVKQQQIKRFYHWQDRQRALLAQLLLETALQYYDFSLDKLKYTSHHRPFVSPHIDFNLSHAGHYVVCAIMSAGRVGIDIEPVRPIELNDFKSVFTVKQWQEIATPLPNYQAFFHYWTMKEAIIKADGRGLAIPLESLEIIDQQIHLAGITWFLHPIALADNYACHVATNLAKPLFTKHDCNYFYD